MLLAAEHAGGDDAIRSDLASHIVQAAEERPDPHRSVLAGIIPSTRTIELWCEETGLVSASAHPTFAAINDLETEHKTRVVEGASGAVHLSFGSSSSLPAPLAPPSTTAPAPRAPDAQPSH